MKVYLTQKLSISEIFGYKTNFKNIDVFVNDFCGNIDILTSFGGFIVQSIFEKFPFSLRKEKVCLFAYSFYSGYLQVTLIFYCVFVTKITRITNQEEILKSSILRSTEAATGDVL